MKGRDERVGTVRLMKMNEVALFSAVSYFDSLTTRQLFDSTTVISTAVLFF